MSMYDLTYLGNSLNKCNKCGAIVESGIFNIYNHFLNCGSSKYTNEIPGMRSTQVLTVEGEDGIEHKVIDSGKWTSFGNTMFGFHEPWPIDPNAPKQTIQEVIT